MIVFLRRALFHSLAVLVFLTLSAGPLTAAAAEELPAIGIGQGQSYPDFLLPKLDGELGRLSDYRGKKVLLFHFASW